MTKINRINNEKSVLTVHFFAIIGLSLILFMNYSFNNDYLSLVCTFFVCVYILIGSRENILPTMIYLSLFSNLFRFGQYNIYVFICVAFIVKVAIDRKYIQYALIVLPIYFITHLFSTDFRAVKLGDFIPLFTILCLFFASCIYKSKYRQKCIEAFLIGFFVSSVLALFKDSTRLKEILETDYIYADGLLERFSGLVFDCNFYAILAIISLCILLFNYEYEIKNLAVQILLIGIAIVFGVMTYSKSYALCLFLVAVMAIFGAPKRVKKGLFMALPLILLLGIIFSAKIESIWNVFLDRFNTGGDFDINDLTTGRVDIWKNYIVMIGSSLSSVLFGNGIQTIEGLSAAHNTYLEILFKFGGLGFFIDLALVWVSYKLIARKSIKINVANITMIGVVVVLLFNLSAYTVHWLWTSIFIVGLLVKPIETRQKDDDEYYSSCL